MNFKEVVDFVLGKQKINFVFILVLLLALLGVRVPVEGVDAAKVTQWVALAVGLWEMYSRWKAQ